MPDAKAVGVGGVVLISAITALVVVAAWTAIGVTLAVKVGRTEAAQQRQMRAA